MYVNTDILKTDKFKMWVMVDVKGTMCMRCVSMYCFYALYTNNKK